MRINWKILLLTFLVGFGFYQHFEHRPVIHGAGVLVAEDPVQGSPGAAAVQTLNGYRLLPLAAFSIRARVLGRENYHFGREADLSPLDLALGWGRMSDEAVLNHIDIRQGGRFYFWYVNAFPIPRNEIETHSANMHMIPADADVEKVLKSVRVGQVVTLHGYLVEARSDDGWHWRSSLTRSDTGSGACELVLVNHVGVM